MDRPMFSQIPLQPITSRTVQGPNKQTKQIQTSFTKAFNQALANESNHLTISKHASERLRQRGIHIDSNQWGKISAKVAEAKDKGVTESLVIVKNAALVVSAKNETVITAMNLQEASEQIFTNINGAIIVN
ncbi:TIGR02530 family flagellar biosynthesis protein [Heyndrickxia sp. NPDC080065]|uniref:TIGR02530 family flagellar biosynthesis protein n=1 Tax=Heyndrickxia sp. NPDC080065 TaxID=3390568 RepID=UPI003D04FEBF